MPEAFRPRSSSGFKDSVILALSRKKRKYSKSEEWSFPLRSLKRRREAEQQWQPSFSLADRTPEPVDKWTFEICVSECSHLADNTDWSSSTSSIQRLPTITSPLPKTEERKAVFLDSKCPVTNPDKPLPAKRLKRNGALLRRLLTREPRSPPTDLTKIDWVRRDGLSFRMSMPIFQYHPKPVRDAVSEAVPVIHYSEERAKRAQQYFQNRVEKLLFKPKMELPPTTTAEQSRQWELMTPSVAPAVVSLTPSSTISVVGSQSVMSSLSTAPSFATFAPVTTSPSVAFSFAPMPATFSTNLTSTAANSSAPFIFGHHQQSSISKMMVLKLYLSNCQRMNYVIVIKCKSANSRVLVYDT